MVSAGVGAPRLTAWPPVWRTALVALRVARGFDVPSAAAASAPASVAHEVRLAKAVALWRSELDPPGALTVQHWLAALNRVRRRPATALSSLAAMVTVANALFVAAGLPPFGADAAVAATLRSTRKSAVTPALRRHVVFDLFAFFRRARQLLPPPPPGASLRDLRNHAACMVVMFTGWRLVDVSRLVWDDALPSSTSVALVRIGYSKGQRLRAARGRAASDPRPLGCSGYDLCAHCAVVRYARASRDVRRPPLPDLPPCSLPSADLPRPLFVSHDSRQTAAVKGSTLTRGLRPVVADMGVAGADVYTLRALVSSAMRFHGFSVEDVCAWCGWASASTFTAFYQVVRQLPIPRSADPRWDAFPAVLARAAWA